MTAWGQRALRASHRVLETNGSNVAIAGARLKTLSMGHRNTLADALYLKAVYQWGQRSSDPRRYTIMAQALTQALELDPNYEAAYILTAAALAGNTVDISWALGVLRLGAQVVRDSWRVQLLYGFHAYEQQVDAHGSAAALAQAASLPGSPPFLPYIAARASAQAHDPKMGLALLAALERSTSNPHQLALYQERKRWLWLELAIDAAQRAVDAYCAHHAEPPSAWQNLLDAGQLSQIPQDPIGGTLELDGCRAVRSAHEAQRLSRVPPPSDVHP